MKVSELKRAVRFLLSGVTGLVFVVTAFASVRSADAGVELAPLRIVSVDEDAGPNCLGLAVAGLGDVDGDGRGDFVVGAPNNGPTCIGGVGNPPGAYVFSGHTGQLLFRLVPNGPEQIQSRFGAAVAGIGDVDGDSMPDILVGAPELDVLGIPSSGAAFVFSGADGHQLARLAGVPGGRQGRVVCNIGDLDADGVSDFAVSGQAPDSVGNLVDAVYTYSGKTDSLLFKLFGDAPNEGFGASLAPIDDADGDGKPDIVVGSPDAICATRTGAVYLFSGATGALVRKTCGPTTNAEFGACVAVSADRDSDNHQDFLVGAPSRSIPQGGTASRFSGATSVLLHTFMGVPLEGFGESIADVGDCDGDGVSETAIGSPWSSTQNPVTAFGGKVRVYSGVADSLMFTASGTVDDAHLGVATAGIGDVNGDGHADLVSGEPMTPGCRVQGVAGVAVVYGIVDVRDGHTVANQIATHLDSGNPLTIRIEPSSASFAASDIDTATLILRTDGEALRSIRAISADRNAGDSDANGIAESSVTFSKDDVRWLLCNPRYPETQPTLLLEGDLAPSGRLRVPVELEALPAAGLRATVSPNPIQSTGYLTFRTTRDGSVRVRLFSVSGRLVRTLLDTSMPLGFHDLALSNAGLPSGVYVYRIDSPEGPRSGRLVLLH